MKSSPSTTVSLALLGGVVLLLLAPYAGCSGLRSTQHTRSSTHLEQEHLDPPSAEASTGDGRNSDDTLDQIEELLSN
ncbi:MAG: hypothetical protein RL518_1946 [Pseudomonadota bacterium]